MGREEGEREGEKWRGRRGIKGEGKRAREKGREA